MVKTVKSAAGEMIKVEASNARQYIEHSSSRRDLANYPQVKALRRVQLRQRNCKQIMMF
jgi:hypothetical protein